MIDALLAKPLESLLVPSLLLAGVLVYYIGLRQLLKAREISAKLERMQRELHEIEAGGGGPVSSNDTTPKKMPHVTRAA